MRLFARHRPGQPPAGTQTVVSFGPEPIGAMQVEAIYARQGALLAGFTTPTPAGWGGRGSNATTDNTVWASPQAFTAAGGKTAMSIWAVGADKPTVYPQDAHTAQIVLPGPSGI